MADDASPSGRGGRRCATPTRVDLLALLLAATLCSASYCLGVWHNSRGAADGRVLALSPAAAVAVGAASSCGGDSDGPLDFEARHAAEDAGLSVSATAASTRARRALRGAAPGRTGRRGVASAARVGGSGLRSADAGAVGG
ncbi:uncharacterized protein LOC120691482 [Panicum virgatum]|uniref:Uncharacterized protein n=1 Tax=Panicum virgatum TaxID=38727 RepID=A0A8T0MSY8_PANVG|nr:uncharacterized protein LOC120691482 [Panicum virgatum]KAG2539838.1 hypothetical protein PVAP13_9NG498412 [Panicum virgatum]